MKDAIVNINGEVFEDPSGAKISIFDRGFLYGDSLYEVARSYHGKFFMLDEHMIRLEKSAQLCKMELDKTPEFYKNEIYKTFHAFRKIKSPTSEAYVRIIITRGLGKIGFGLQNLLSPPTFVIIMQPVDVYTPEQKEKGMKLKIVKRIRNDARALDPAMKSGNYLNNLLSYLEASEDKFDDALLCNSEGHLTEGTTFNIFYVKRGIVATPPLDVGILDGITRRHVLKLANNAGLETREVRFPAEILKEADEVFVSSSLREVFPVSQIDDTLMSQGKAGPITRKLAEVYSATLP
jgi:branched-chain amino acid aminotransferase